VGERKTSALRVNCDRTLKLEFHGVKVTSAFGSKIFGQQQKAVDFQDRPCIVSADKLAGVAEYI